MCSISNTGRLQQMEYRGASCKSLSVAPTIYKEKAPGSYYVKSTYMLFVSLNY